MTGMTENDFVQGIQYRLPSYEKYKSSVTKPLPHIQSRDEPSSIEEAAVRTDVSRHAITINEQVEEVLKRLTTTEVSLETSPKAEGKKKALGLFDANSKQSKLWWNNYYNFTTTT